MFEDWIDTLFGGSHDINLTTLNVSGCGACNLSGSGRLSWCRAEGLRLHGVTDGADAILGRTFGRAGTPGQLIPRSAFLTFSGRSQYGWDVTTDQTTGNGSHVHSNLPDVVWDQTVSGVTLTREDEHDRGHTLRFLMGPAPSGWTRGTQTTVENEYFGGTAGTLDWMLTETCIGQVAAQRRSGDWFEVKVVFNSDQTPHDAFAVSGAIARAFGFLLGRRCAIQGHEYVSGRKTIRRLDTRYPKPTKNSLYQPLVG